MDQPEKKRRGVGFWCGCVVLVPVLYVLSFGPVDYILMKAGTSELPRPVSAVYRPLFVIAEYCAPVFDAMD